MYRVATYLLRQWWHDYPRMVAALKVLLLTWNGAFYRYGSFDEGRLERCLRRHSRLIARFRRRDIRSFGESDHADVARLFNALLAALRIGWGPNRGNRSPVGVAKTLHLLAPRFFPPWDNAIAWRYGCSYTSQPARAYVRFCGEIRSRAIELKDRGMPSSELLKRIDEFNYVRYTKGWSLR
jgi:hypothetical protein